MAKNKTTETAGSISAFIDTVNEQQRREDCCSLVEMVKKLTGFEPRMWGPNIVGFGSYHYRYDSGREGDSPLVAFSPRASSIAVYLSGNFDHREALLEKLGKHKTNKGCIHIKALTDINIETLQKMISNHISHIKKIYPAK